MCVVVGVVVAGFGLWTVSVGFAFGCVTDTRACNRVSFGVADANVFAILVAHSDRLNIDVEVCFGAGVVGDDRHVAGNALLLIRWFRVAFATGAGKRVGDIVRDGSDTVARDIVFGWWFGHICRWHCI